jgi:hypothetical protein
MRSTPMVKVREAFEGLGAIAGLVAALWIVGVPATAARAGTVESEGSTTLWNNAVDYRTWNTLLDPTIYVGVEPVEGRATDMAFHNGTLYVTHPSLLIDAGPMLYSPGATGDLSSPSTMRVPVPPQSDPRRWIHGRFAAINTSGSGFGAFNGPSATLAMLGNGNLSNTSSFSLTPAGGVEVTMSQLGPGPAFASSFEYAASIDRFVYTETDPSPGVSVFYFATHDATGLTGFQQAFTAPLSGVRGMDMITGSFASSLLGMPVTEDEVILVLSTNLIGAGTPSQLSVYTLAGTRIGELADLSMLPASATFGQGLAVDEAAGNIYIGEKLDGRIVVIHVPAPGAAMATNGTITQVIGSTFDAQFPEDSSRRSTTR